MENCGEGKRLISDENEMYLMEASWDVAEDLPPRTAQQLWSEPDRSVCVIHTAPGPHIEPQPPSRLHSFLKAKLGLRVTKGLGRDSASGLP